MNRIIFSGILLVVLSFIILIPSICIGSDKILYVNSYHKGYPWSDDIEKGLRKALGMKTDDNKVHSETIGKGILLKIVRMDTKHKSSEKSKQNAAIEVKTVIDHWQPDLIIASDDNASKYLIAPHLKESSIPIIFCGINWDVSIYGYPYPNMTGMIEVDPLRETLEILRPFSKGEKIGFLGNDDLSNQKKIPFHKRVLEINYTDGKLVSTFEQWKEQFLRLQESVDILIIFSPVGISGWDFQEARQFVNANATIPSGNIDMHTRSLALVGRVKISEEQGWWAGKTALKILAGAHPSTIPVTMNKNSKLYLNMGLSKKLGVKFPVDLFESAILVEQLPEK